MRPIRLARIAADAEVLRWQAIAARTITRMVCAIVAAVFLLGVLAIAHVAAWYALRVDAGLAFYWTALAIAGFDLIVAVILLLVARSSTPSRVEREALEVRQRAVAGLGSTLSLAQLALSIVRIATSSWRRGRRV